MPKDEKKYHFNSKKMVVHGREPSVDWRKQSRKTVVPGSKSLVVSQLVTRLPKHTWRIDSRNMSIRHEVDLFAQKTKENFITLVITIVGMATALTWNEVVKSIIDAFFVDRSAIYAKIYVAVIATVFTLIATYMISRIRNR